MNFIFLWSITAFFGLPAEIWALAVSAEIPSNETTTSEVGFPAAVIVPLMIPLFIATSAPCTWAAIKGSKRANRRTCRRVIFLLLVLDLRQNPHFESRRPSPPPVFLRCPTSRATLSSDSFRRECHCADILHRHL